VTAATHRPLPVTRGPLPLTPDALTAGWLTGALAAAGHPAEVTGLTVARVIPGTATKVLVEAAYAGPAEPPARLCVKGGFNEELRRFAPGNIYASEAVAFAEVHPLLGTPAPRCWFAGIDEAESHGIVVLDDVSGPGTTFGAPLRPLDRDEVAAGLEAQARWHAGSYGWTTADAPNVPVGSTVVRDAGQTLLSPGYWEQHYAQDWAPVLPADQRDQARTRAAVEALYAANDAGPLCFVHGDAHLGNTYRLADGALEFLDWQAINLGSWAYDVAYFVAGALTVEDRRAHERDLLGHYLGALAGLGGPALDPDEAFREYRLNCLHGFLWTTTPAAMQPPENTVAMSGRHTAAITDHDSIALALGEA
jgi:hypothetical protein